MSNVVLGQGAMATTACPACEFPNLPWDDRCDLCSHPLVARATKPAPKAPATPLPSAKAAAVRNLLVKLKTGLAAMAEAERERASTMVAAPPPPPLAAKADGGDFAPDPKRQRRDHGSSGLHLESATPRTSSQEPPRRRRPEPAGHPSSAPSAVSTATAGPPPAAAPSSSRRPIFTERVDGHRRILSAPLGKGDSRWRTLTYYPDHLMMTWMLEGAERLLVKHMQQVTQSEWSTLVLSTTIGDFNSALSELERRQTEAGTLSGNCTQAIAAQLGDGSNEMR